MIKTDEQTKHGIHDRLLRLRAAKQPLRPQDLLCLEINDAGVRNFRPRKSSKMRDPGPQNQNFQWVSILSNNLLISISMDFMICSSWIPQLDPIKVDFPSSKRDDAIHPAE